METNEPSAQSKSAVVRPATFTVKAHFPQGSIAIRPNLWHNWARLAIRAEARATAASRGGQGADDIAPYVDAMTLETMIAVTAVRSSFHHLYLDWHALLGLRPEGDEQNVPELATTAIRQNHKERIAWLGAIKKVIEDRDRIVHEAQDSQTAVRHPLGGNTSALDAYYTSTLATTAVDVMLDFYARVITSPTDALREWAEKRSHVAQQLNDLRASHRDHGDG
jgi:hypothetical protein